MGAPRASLVNAGGALAWSISIERYRASPVCVGAVRAPHPRVASGSPPESCLPRHRALEVHHWHIIALGNSHRASPARTENIRPRERASRIIAGGHARASRAPNQCSAPIDVSSVGTRTSRSVAGRSAQASCTQFVQRGAPSTPHPRIAGGITRASHVLSPCREHAGPPVVARSC